MVSNTAEGEFARRGAVGAKSIFFTLVAAGLRCDADDSLEES
jgi:hypothetical protein